MFNNEFIPLKCVPTDLKSSIDTLTTMVKPLKDDNILLKVGAIQGAYAVYERTKDVTILEHLIVDIVLLFQSILPISRTMDYTLDVDVYGVKRTDLLYYQSSDNQPDFSPEELIEEFLKACEYTGATRNIYSAGLRKVLKDIKERGILPATPSALADEMRSTVKEKGTYNHNIKTAVNRFKNYIDK